MPKTWLSPQEVSPPEPLTEAVGGHPLVAQTLARRGITDPEAALAFLDPAHYTPAPPSDLPGLTRAADRIEQAIQRGETILVWGDFDVDGQTSTTLLVEALRSLGANVTYHIPVRLTEGHGIKPEILAKFLTPTLLTPNPLTSNPLTPNYLTPNSLTSNPLTPNYLTPNSLTPNLLLTCDTGIAAHEAVEFANSRGVDVIITDHHDLPETLPDAYAIVNPKLLPHPHPLITLPGVGVVYKLVEELIDRRPTTTDRRPQTADRRPQTEDGTQSPVPNLQSPVSNLQSPASNLQSPISNLDLVALGIVADVAEQTGDARYLLQLGLQALRSTQRLGLQTLMEVAKIIPAHLDEGHIGFGIGPRLNALGRLSDANPIVEFLTTGDLARARVVAHQLEGLNERRKLLTDQIYQAALSQIERDRSLLDHAALVLAHPGWHTGVIGIVASRLVDRFGKPAILLAIADDGSARGSARSVEGIHITEAIAAQKEMLTGFGGHPMAAGLSLPAGNIPRFRRGLSRAVHAMIGDQPLEAALQIDAYLPLAELSLDLVDDLERLAPFGAGNPPLILASRGLKLVSHTVIGRTREHLRLVVADEAGNAQNVLWWRGAGEPLPEGDIRFDLAYKAQSNTFRGERRLQLEWQDYRPITAPTPQIQVEAPLPIEVVDYRGEIYPLPILKSLQSRGDVQVWAEGEAKSKLGGANRQELSPGARLAIWNAPPGPQVLAEAVAQAVPEVVYLFSVDPGMDKPEAFLRRLAGLARYALRTKDGYANLLDMAAATAQREGTVRMGLLWLEAKGYVRLEIGDWRLEIGEGSEGRRANGEWRGAGGVERIANGEGRIANGEWRGAEGELRLSAGTGEEGAALAEITAELKAMLDETAAYRKYFGEAGESIIIGL